jgi:hypothetical protein
MAMVNMDVQKAVHQQTTLEVATVVGLQQQLRHRPVNMWYHDGRFHCMGAVTGLVMVHWPTTIDSVGKTITRGSSGRATGRWRSISLKQRDDQALKLAVALMPASPPS